MKTKSAEEILNDNLKKAFNRMIQSVFTKKEPANANESKEPKGLIIFLK